MMLRAISSLLAVAGIASAYHCTNLTVPVSLTSRNGVFDLALPTSEIDVTNFFLQFSYQGGNYTDRILRGYKTVTGNYNLAATYCVPNAGPGDTIQVLTHGIGADKSYWDLPFNNYNYSYVAQATDKHGFSTLSWDRLGVGASSHGKPIAEIQIFLEIAALRVLTNQLRSNKLPHINHAYNKVLHVGHSFGSLMTYALANMYPNITQGIALTGFAHVPNFVAFFALGGGFAPVKEIPALAKQYPAGYLATKSSSGVQANFLAQGDFDPDMLIEAARAGQPTTPGEILTVGSVSGAPSVYCGPVLVITGERDIPFCGGDCNNTAMFPGHLKNLLEISRQFFAKASKFQATVVPGAGHGLNFGYSHAFTYNAISKFFEANA